MIVYPKKMLQNLNLTKGLIFSQELMLELTKTGLSIEKYYRMIQNYEKKLAKMARAGFSYDICKKILS